MLLISTNASKKPLYAALGLPETATESEIHEAFRRIAAAHHPDVATGNPAIFAAAKNAHDILTDPQKRAIYDETGLDPDAPENKLQIQAVGMIRNAFMRVLNDGDIECDIVCKIRMALAAEEGNLRTQIRTLQCRIETCRKLLGNIEKRWQGAQFLKNSISGFVTAQINQIKNEQVPVDQALAIACAAIALLRDVRYEGAQTDSAIAYFSARQPWQKKTI